MSSLPAAQTCKTLIALVLANLLAGPTLEAVAQVPRNHELSVRHAAALTLTTWKGATLLPGAAGVHQHILGTTSGPHGVGVLTRSDGDHLLHVTPGQTGSWTVEDVSVAVGGSNAPLAVRSATVAMDAGGTIRVLAVEPAGRVKQLKKPRGASWTVESTLPNAFEASSGLAAVWAAGTLHLFAANKAGQLLHAQRPGQNWTVENLWSKLGLSDEYLLSTAPAAIETRGVFRDRYFYVAAVTRGGRLVVLTSEVGSGDWTPELVTGANDPIAMSHRPAISPSPVAGTVDVLVADQAGGLRHVYRPGLRRSWSSKTVVNSRTAGNHRVASALTSIGTRADYSYLQLGVLHHRVEGAYLTAPGDVGVVTWYPGNVSGGPEWSHSVTRHAALGVRALVGSSGVAIAESSDDRVIFAIDDQKRLVRLQTRLGGDADEIMRMASQLLQTQNDPNEDVSCSAELTREGDTTPFNLLDGRANTQSDLDALFAVRGDLKVVVDLNWCGGKYNTSAIGCARSGGSILVERTASKALDASLWTHELGHVLGLDHDKTDRRAIMYESEVAGVVQDRVNRMDCAAFESP